MQNSEAAMLSSGQILESLQHPVLVVDANSEITYANATAAASFGGWIVGLTLADIFADYLRSTSIGDGPSSMRLMTRQSETYDALFNPLAGEASASVSGRLPSLPLKWCRLRRTT